MMPDVTLPWEAIDALVTADGRFVTAVRGVVAQLRALNSQPADLEDWLVLRVPDIEWLHRQILDAHAELRSPAPGQSVDWLLLRIHSLAGRRQVLGAAYDQDWNPRISDLMDAALPDGASALQEAVSVVSAAGLDLNRVCDAIRQARQDDPFRDRKMSAENYHWFWGLREESGNRDHHLWNGVEVPIDAPNCAAAIFFAGEADGYVLGRRVPISLRDPDGTQTVRCVSGSLLGTPEERRGQFAELLEGIAEERVILGAELYTGSLPLLSRDEGIFGAWWLTDQQYAELQRLCEAHNWPRDLWVEA